MRKRATWLVQVVAHWVTRENFTTWLVLTTRLGLATLLGAVLGIDRDLHRKPAGLRVLAMVGLGACVAIIDA